MRVGLFRRRLLLVALATVLVMPVTSTWQTRLGGKPGEVVEGDEELAQSLSIVLTTPVASVPGRPGFGSKLDELLDAPLNEVAPKAVREVFRAVRDNEPRITVLGAVVQQLAADGGIRLRVRWRPTSPTNPADARERTTTVDVQRRIV